MSLGLGLIPTNPGIHPWGTHGFTSGDGPDSAFPCADHIARGGNQGNSQTCVWWSWAGAIWATLGALSMPLVWPSVRAGYWSTQMRTHSGNRKALADIGCRMTDAAAVLREVGIVPSTAWPFNVLRVLEEPSFDALIASKDPDWLRPRRIISAGESLCRDVRRTLADGILLVRGTALDAASLSWTSDRGPYRRTGPIVGYHAELLCGYDRTGVHAVSSWGLPDRVDAWEQLASTDTTDVWTCDVDPELLGRMLECLRSRPS